MLPIKDIGAGLNKPRKHVLLIDYDPQVKKQILFF